jgi:hypothetical protein
LLKLSLNVSECKPLASGRDVEALALWDIRGGTKLWEYAGVGVPYTGGRPRRNVFLPLPKFPMLESPNSTYSARIMPNSAD